MDVIYTKVEPRRVGDKRLVLVFTYKKVELIYMSSEPQQRRLEPQKAKKLDSGKVYCSCKLCERSENYPLPTLSEGTVSTAQLFRLFTPPLDPSCEERADTLPSIPTTELLLFWKAELQASFGSLEHDLRPIAHQKAANTPTWIFWNRK